MRPEEQVSADARVTGKGALLTLVIPTRNEAGNVPRLVREIREALAGVDYRVVFVNDSTDETPTVIHALSEEERRISLIHRAIAEQDGDLSTAGATSMDAVVNESEYTCVMDADLQHPPQKVRELLEKARSTEADVVVASRYARGGSYAGLPGPVRKAISAGSKYLTRIVFKEARKTSDPMTGFFLVRNETISGIQFRPTGFKILLEILVCAPELRVAEVPLNFQARNARVSKVTLRQGLEYLAHIISLFWYVPSAGRFWKFALVGASGVLVNLLTLITLVEYFDATSTVAWIIAVGASILSNFLLNNAFTWRDVRHSSRIHFLVRGALTYPVAIIALGANFAVYYPLVQNLGTDFPYYAIAAFLGIIAGTSSNFILSSRFVFRPLRAKRARPQSPARGNRPGGTGGAERGLGRPRASRRPLPHRTIVRRDPRRATPAHHRRQKRHRARAPHFPAHSRGNRPPSSPAGPHQHSLDELPGRPGLGRGASGGCRLRHPQLDRTIHPR